ncbi:S8 family serine peptidase [Limnoraphis robusta Tam1]|uniref:S8 family serine peptidase n=1 Tax=Limnoraphis robusta TaxID=1118279 RepID=UPI002B1F0201|nr:S8 family serine peptidase [Limnoraphis robusta]MEA5500304.1 S8 family serine peptidase [Limnoraphis robusta BA-68 BA1]MEA5538624.1 S8 family serine peptidase [Limnoraphis robusta Tam1]
MFDSQTDFSGLYLYDITGAENLDGFVSSMSQFPTLESLEPVIIPEFLGDHRSDYPQTHPSVDLLTGEQLSSISSSLSNELIFPDTPLISNDSLITAQDLGVLEGTQIINDSVGTFDLDDYYRLQLNSPKDLTLSLDGLIADADLKLIADYNSNGIVDYGEVINSFIQSGSLPENISANLPPGTYYVNVQQYSGDTPYTLTLSTTEPVPGFNSVDGYGLVNAAAAVSRGIGSPVPFADVLDTNYPWELNATNVPEVWTQGFTGEGVVVAVLDTGVDYTHPDLDSRIWQNIDEIPGNGLDDDRNGYTDDIIGWDFLNNNGFPMDFDGHGTHVAGIVAAEANEFGMTGVAPNAQIMPIRVTMTVDQLGIDSIASGIYYAVNNGADVINMSLGYYDYYNDLTPLQQAVQFATENGVVVVSSAGNDYWFSPKYPAGYATDWGIAVGASNINNQFADFSNQAGWIPLDYVVAPGVEVYSTIPYNSYSLADGTSMAAPHVAGVAALMLSANPNLTVGEVEQILTQTANPDVLIA